MKPKPTLKRQARLRRAREFKEVYQWGQRLSRPHLVIFFKPNHLDCTRIGLSVAKKRFKLSTQRHYIQRRLREAYRRNKWQFLPGYDIVIQALKFNKDNIRLEDDIEKELLSLAQEARLLKDRQ